MAEYMILICDDEQAREALPASEMAANYAKVGAWWQEHEQNGFFLPASGRRLQPTKTAKTLRVSDAFVVDGPFAETKEAIGGYAIVNAPDIDAALAVLKTWPGLPVTIEVRPVLT